MKKSILFLVLAALLASAPLFAQIGITTGVESDFGDVANEDRAKNAVPITVSPFIEYVHEFANLGPGALGLDVTFKIPLAFISDKKYAPGTYQDRAADPRKDLLSTGNPEAGVKNSVFHSEIYLEEDINYKLPAGPGSLIIGVNNKDSVQIVPGLPHKNWSRFDYLGAGYDLGDGKGYVGVYGTVTPSLKYEFPVAGLLSAKIKVPIEYAKGDTPIEKTEKDYGAQVDLGWVIDWESAFGVGVEYENIISSLADHDTSTSVEADNAQISWAITPRYTLGNLVAKLGVSFITWAGAGSASDWNKYNANFTLTPKVEYKLLNKALKLEGSVAIGNIGAKKLGTDDAANVSVVPVIKAGYSF